MSVDLLEQRISGLDLFSGIGGLTLALAPWIRPVAYCENDKYAQAVLLTRQHSGDLPVAPIWNDVRTLQASLLPHDIEIIYGGFPCQDISVAGSGAGLAGKRSGLFSEIARLVGELRPSFVFLENVPAIRGRGADVVVGRLAELGYDCRWDVLSAFDVGAPHLRERWWLLAHRNDKRCKIESSSRLHDRWQLGHDTARLRHDVPDADSERVRNAEQRTTWRWNDIQDRWRPELVNDGEQESLADANGERLQAWSEGRQAGERRRTVVGCSSDDVRDTDGERQDSLGSISRRQNAVDQGASWWTTEPNVGRVAHGLRGRVDRLRALGNAVVPSQAREAFVRLMGISR